MSLQERRRSPPSGLSTPACRRSWRPRTAHLSNTDPLSVLLHHDNASVHTIAATLDCLECPHHCRHSGLPGVSTPLPPLWTAWRRSRSAGPQLSCSPDLALYCDFILSLPSSEAAVEGEAVSRCRSAGDFAEGAILPKYSASVVWHHGHVVYIQSEWSDTMVTCCIFSQNGLTPWSRGVYSVRVV